MNEQRSHIGISSATDAAEFAQVSAAVFFGCHAEPSRLYATIFKKFWCADRRDKSAVLNNPMPLTSSMRLMTLLLLKRFAIVSSQASSDAVQFFISASNWLTRMTIGCITGSSAMMGAIFKNAARPSGQ